MTTATSTSAATISPSSEPLHQQVNYRVEVWPDHYRYVNHDLKALCEEIMASVKRHVDNVGRIQIKSDTVCRTCSNPWEEPPICCDTAIEGWRREHPEWSLDDDYNWHKAVGE